MCLKFTKVSEKKDGTGRPSRGSIQFCDFVIEICVPPSCGQQFVVVAPLHDPAFFQHHDGVGLSNGGQTVGDDKGGDIDSQGDTGIISCIIYHRWRHRL